MDVTMDGEIYKVSNYSSMTREELFEDVLELQDENMKLKNKINCLESQISQLTLDVYFYKKVAEKDE